MIEKTFRRLAARQEMALMPYLVAGYPDLGRSLEHLRTIARSGADLIEVGVPFSDPVADGPTIQQASFEALQAGARLEEILAGVATLKLDLPLVLMSYLNPLLAYGRDRLFESMQRCGFHGLIVPDLPIEESERWSELARSRAIPLIQLVAPTSSEERLRRIAERSAGFLYYVSVAGTTGVRAQLPAELAPALRRLRQFARCPLAVGFGISEPEQIRELRGVAEGVVVGSRIVEAIRRGEPLTDLIRRLKSATKEPKTC